MEFEDYAKDEEITWKQRSRTPRLKQGNRNTKFFQRIVDVHMRNKYIDLLVVEGETIVETTDIKREIITFYEKLFSDTAEWRPCCNMNNCPSVTTEEQEELQKPIEKKEAGNVFKLCVTYKTPKPDGYTMVLFNQMLETNKHI